MSTGVKFFGVLLGVPALILGVLYVNTYVYPFQSKQPNYADVEQAFAKLQFPAGWQEISSTENRGIAGRGCDPFDASGCFHKGRTFKVDNVAVAKEKLKEMFRAQGGCASISDEAIPEGNSSTDPRTASNVSCRINNGVVYGASTSEQKGRVSVSARTY